MKIKCFAMLFVMIPVFLAGNVFALTDIGNGFKCDGTQIIKGTKTIKYSKAKSNTATTLQKLKDKLQNAPKNKKQGIKDKIKVVKDVSKSLKLCSKGQLPDGQVDPLFSQLAGNGGNFSGTYQGFVNSFLGNIPVNGPLSIKFTLNGTVFKTVLTLGGQVGNALDAQPLNFEADVNGLPLPLQIQIPDTFLGVVNLQINADGSLTVANEGNAVTFNGQFADQSINGDLAGNYKGTAFSGSFTLNRS